ncbi:MAG: hypothetical protein J07HQW2_00444 [Haloquadratum walsbyi J07HQW2]|uniref:Uncharacterized protein n=1 Tax=Haloquadratum walsbyi J07HQW2 TaxID=1238425 RepID=U1NAY7_9EURY|nr:MAG: hypothetical protein J07HQW2_00444 [Haloquadratum walsbyi J07HQW2]
MSSPAQSNVSSSPVTSRDRVWSGVVTEVQIEFTVADIQSRLRRDGYEGEPNEGRSNVC